MNIYISALMELHQKEYEFYIKIPQAEVFVGGFYTWWCNIKVKDVTCNVSRRNSI